MRTHYEALGLAPGASPSQIKAAYRELARKMHPDAGGDTGEFTDLNNAYHTLIDPKSRKDYDGLIALTMDVCDKCCGRGVTYNLRNVEKRCASCNGKGYHERQSNAGGKVRPKKRA